MTLSAYSRRAPRTVEPGTTLLAAAQRMEKENTGFLLVTAMGRLEGVLTDRDIALAVLAEERDPSETRVREVMSRPVLSVAAEESVEDALRLMARARIRRLPVLDGERIEGVVSADDLALLLSREIGGLAEVLVAQLPPGASRAVAAEQRGGGRIGFERARREVVALEAAEAVARIARAMEEENVGSAIVVEDGRAVGIVTDRDLALRVVAAGRDPSRTEARSVMSTPLISAGPDDPLEEVVARMRTAGVRRIPILEEGTPVGLVSFDDLVVALGRELHLLARAIEREVSPGLARATREWIRRDLEPGLEDLAGRLREVGERTFRNLGREIGEVLDRLALSRRAGGGARREGRVRDLMQTEVRACRADEALSEAIRIMAERDCGFVPVLAADGSGRVVGVVTDRDACLAIHREGRLPGEILVEAVMSRPPLCCRPEDGLAAAEAILRSAQVRRLPVVDDAGHLRGVLSLADLAEAAVGFHAPRGLVTSEEVARVLEAICRPRSALVPAEKGGREGRSGEEASAT